MDQYVTPEFSTFLFELMSVYQLPLPLSMAREIYVDLHGTEYWFSQFLLDRFQNVEKPDDKVIYGNLLYAHMEFASNASGI